MISAKSSSAELSAHYVAKAKALVAEMTLEEKALLLSGDGWWRTHRIDPLQIPSICMTDGPHGLRKVEGEGLGPPLGAATSSIFRKTPSWRAKWQRPTSKGSKAKASTRR
jgi:beta-glucosidase